MLAEQLKRLTLNELLGRLSSSLRGFAAELASAVDRNRGISMDDLAHLRDHITRKLSEGVETAENRKLLSVLDLVATDKAVVEAIKKNADDWLAFLDAIEDNIRGRESLSESERLDLERIERLTAEIRRLLRK
ncbi:MAG: hypothetical protein M1474_02520 [Candidatus Marsarchaeota archaeon]|jgi:hypothetical protein|nr:hypothetical protein [Candidatus Marsarchaeota archaeon]